MQIILLILGFVIGRLSVPYKRKKASDNIKALLTHALPKKKIVILRKDIPITENEKTIGILERKRKDIKVLKK